MSMTSAETNGHAAMMLDDDGGGGRGISAFSSRANFETAQRMAKSLAVSSLVPKAYQGINNIPNVLIALEVASRVGASVFAVMQNLDIIHGTPSWRAKFLIATVNACGRFSSLRWRWEGVRGTESWGCRAVAKELATGEECMGPLVNIAMAKAEGWSTKAGSKWLTMPELMLCYRSAAFWTRLFAPELSLGMSTSEEVSDVIEARAFRPSNANAATRDLEAALLGKVAPTTESEPAAKPDSKPTVTLDMPEIDPETGEIIPDGVGV